MAELKRIEGQVVLDYMARDYDSLLRSMRELIPHKLPEWTDYESEADFGNVLLQLFAHMGDILSYYQDRVAAESFLATARTRASVIHHLRLIGYRLATAAPASTTLTLTIPAERTETITISKGDAFATKSAKDKPSVRFEYTAEEPLVIQAGELAVDPSTGKKIVREVPVEEGLLIREELLGVSDGAPNQRYPLAQVGVILRSLGQGQRITRDIVLRSELGSEITAWNLQESLAFSRVGQHDFVLDVDENDRATVRFGDGEFGAIPPTGSSILATYRVGGGTRGNVPARSIQTIVDAPQLTVLGVKVTNPKPATGGAERESIERAVEHAPSVFRSLKRSVTASDYEALAQDFSGVGKVRARATNWNTVKLYVAPQGGGQVSDVLEANLLAYFEDLRPLSTIIEIEDVEYIDIYVSARVNVSSYYSRDQIAEQVRNEAGGLIAFDAVAFGRPIFLSKFYEKIEAIDGVESVFISEFRRGDRPTPLIEPDGRIEFEPFELPVPSMAAGYDGRIRVIVEGGF